jgi:polyadenylation factor subunit 2
MAYLQNIEAHREQVRGLSFAPSDSKFASCSDDKTVIIWDLESRKSVQVLSEHRLYVFQ